MGLPLMMTTPLQTEMGEARMDVIDSEIAYLGYHESESYGLVWKVNRTGRSQSRRYDVTWYDMAP